MRTLFIAIACCMTAGLTAVAADTPQDRLNSAATVFSEVMQTPDKTIPRDLVQSSQCIVVLSGVKKAAFVVGGDFGRGFAECRNDSNSGWSAPAAVELEGGSIGFQIGGSSTDLILLVRNRDGMDKLLQDKFTLGADASVAAGPVGRQATAETDVQLHAEILAWSRSRGAFAGVSLSGAVLHADSDVNAQLYGHQANNREILAGKVAPPPGANRLTTELAQYGMGRQGEAERSRK